MILPDTSVWIEFFRGRDRDLGRELQRLLDLDEVILAAPVRIEILSGCSRATLGKLRRLLSALPVFRPDAATWERMDQWVEKAALSGDRFGVGDLLIASIAVDQGCLLWTLDSDFRRMEKMGWLKLYDPSSTD